MPSTREHIGLVYTRLCKNRTSLHFALQAAKREHLPTVEFLRINHAYNATIAMIDDLDTVLTFFGPPPGRVTVTRPFPRGE